MCVTRLIPMCHVTHVMSHMWIQIYESCNRYQPVDMCCTTHSYVSCHTCEYRCMSRVTDINQLICVDILYQEKHTVACLAQYWARQATCRLLICVARLFDISNVDMYVSMWVMLLHTIYLCAKTYICVLWYISMRAYIYVLCYISMCYDIYLCARIYLCVMIYMYLLWYIWIRICAHSYTYNNMSVYIYAHTHICIHTYIAKYRLLICVARLFDISNVDMCCTTAHMKCWYVLHDCFPCMSWYVLHDIVSTTVWVDMCCTTVFRVWVVWVDICCTTHTVLLTMTRRCMWHDWQQVNLCYTTHTFVFTRTRE